MAQAEDTVAIEVTPDVARLIAEAVARGQYASANDAIRGAFEELNARSDDLLGYTPEDIARLWDEGIASGPGGALDPEEIKREVRGRIGSPLPKR